MTTAALAGGIRKICFSVGLLTAGAWTLGCGGGGAGFVVPSPTPPPSISVSVTPTSSTVILGNTQAFTARVINTNDKAVTWSVNGVTGGTAATGLITAAGIYTAPADLPVPGAIQVIATSHADTTKSGTASLTIASDIGLAIMPASANVELGASQQFHARVSSSGHPDPAVRWSVSGAACPSACGTVDVNGNYTAPQILPQPANVSVIAQSIADPTRQASVSVNITSNFLFQLSAPSSVSTGASVAITATLTPVPASRPSSVVAWALSGAGCNGAACGTLVTGATSTGVSGTITNTATYTAPLTAPSPNSITITATPQADPTKRAQTTLSIQTGVSVSLIPTSTTLAVNHRTTLTVQVTGTSNTSVAWSVNGVPGGNTTVGLICVLASNPCQMATSGNAPQVEFLAPGALPQPNPVTVQAVSAADPAQSASAQITVINHVIVTVQPASVTLAPLAVQGFTATVLGTANQSVVWQVQGTGCISARICGTINSNGTYTAPGAPPNPNTLQVVAISSDDTTQSGTANVTISSGTDILALHPASVYAGGAAGFNLRVEGSGFTPSSPGPGSVLLIGGTARTTTCTSGADCTAPVTPADVAAAGNVSVQIQNPDGSKSNAVSLVVVAPGSSDDLISLTSSTPAATGKTIAVVDPTTAGVSVPGDHVDLNIAALGTFSTVNNSCTLAGNPLVLLRPPSGISTTDVCLFSQSGLDTSMSYIASGSGDVAVISKQPAGLGIIHLTLQISASAIPGARTLFIQNTNLDKTAASGALEVQ
jgi:uncharacterized protein YjdB